MRAPPLCRTSIRPSICRAAWRNASTDSACATCSAIRWLWLETKPIRSSWLSTPTMRSPSRTSTRCTRWRIIISSASNSAASVPMLIRSKRATRPTASRWGGSGWSSASRRSVVVNMPMRSRPSCCSRTSVLVRPWSARTRQTETMSRLPSTKCAGRMKASPMGAIISDRNSRSRRRPSPACNCPPSPANRAALKPALPLMPSSTRALGISQALTASSATRDPVQRPASKARTANSSPGAYTATPSPASASCTWPLASR